MVASAVKTTCPYCGVGCGVLVTPDGNGGASVVGDPEHPSNFGRLCSKGSALGETLDPASRLLHPKIAGERVSWDVALDHVASGLARTIERHGPSSVAVYLSGQLLTEDYYVPNKLMKGFIGSGQHRHQFPPVHGLRRRRPQVRAFGVGCGARGATRTWRRPTSGGAGRQRISPWCHPVLFQRLVKAAREARGTSIVVVVDPRRQRHRRRMPRICSLHDRRRGTDVTALFNPACWSHLADGGYDRP